MLPQNCVLCLSSESRTFLTVFCKNNQSSQNMSVIIAKHLGFNLHLSKDSCVCEDCWTSVFDFHVFYCKLESIHIGEWLDCDLSNVQDIVRPNETHEDSEMSPDGVAEPEPSEARLAEDEDAGRELSRNNNHSSITGHTSGRPKRQINAPKRYNADVCHMEKPYFLEVNIAIADQGIPSGGDEVIDYDALTDEKGPCNTGTNDDDDERPVKKFDTDTTMPTPKRRRGRPPKSAKRATSSVKSRAGEKSVSNVRRSANNEINAMSSEPEQESDYESSQQVRTNANHKRKMKVSDKMFEYIDEFACHYCPEKVLFTRFSEADMHYKAVHFERAFLKCPKCEKKMYSPGTFVSHMETHDNPDHSRCKVCGKITDSDISLYKHMRIHHEILEASFPFPCRKCPRRFVQESERSQHMRRHVPKRIVHKQHGRDETMLAFYKRIYCDLCEAAEPESTSFDNYWELMLHMKKQHKALPYIKCPLCLKRYATRHQIMMHIDVHKNPELYRCEVCKEIHQNLDRHMIHAHSPAITTAAKKSYNCERCSRTFQFRWKLKYHMNEAHGKKEVSCDICKKFFTRPGLAAHKRKAHVEGKATFLCDHCPKMYASPSALRTHVASSHENRKKQTKCNVCGKEVNYLEKHMRTVHPPEGSVSCDLCGKRFRAAFHMMRHRTNTCPASVASRPFKCEVCGKGFGVKLTMIEHMTTHTRTNRYQCAFCLKTYGYISNLQKHRKKAHPLEWEETQGDQSIVTVIPLDT